MNKMIFAFGLVGILGIFNLGCSSKDCVSQCEAYNKCDGATKIDDCSKACEPSKFEEADICVAESDAVESCQLATADVCVQPDPACADEIKTAGECITKFCTDNPMDAACKI